LCWINAEEVRAFFGQHAILVFVLVLGALFATGICLRCLLAQPESSVLHFAPADDQHVQDSANLCTFRDRFFRPFANGDYGPSLDDHLGLYLSISLFVLTATSGSFLVLALEIGQQDWLVRFDHSLSASLYEHSTVNAVRIFQLVSVFGDASTLAMDLSLSHRSMPSSSTPNATKSLSFGWKLFQAALRAAIIWPSSIRLRAARFIGDCPCLADTMMAVLLRSPRLPRALTILPRDWSTKSSALVKDRPGSSTIGKITARCASRQVTVRPGSWQLLGCRNRLEVHPKDCRRPRVTGAIVMMTIDPVDDRLNLVTVVLLSENVIRRPVGLVGVSWCGCARAAVDLGRKVLIDAFARRSGQGQVGGMLVRPRGTQMMLVSYLENGVYVQIPVGIDWLAVLLRSSPGTVLC
jgi:hypothetical protein